MQHVITVAEDCAGLGTATVALRRDARRVTRKTGMGFKIEALYASEKDDALRNFLKARWANNNHKNVDSAEAGSSDKGNKLFGTDGQVTLYVGGTECQPFSNMGRNAGKKDERSETMRDAIAFVSKRKPKVFILEQVKNITSKTHK